MNKLIYFLLTILTISSLMYSQTEWQKDVTNPVLVRGESGEWDDGFVAGPSVIFNGSSYQMWYAGNDGSSGTNIGYATSTDGIDWTKNLGNNPVLMSGPPGAWDETTVFQPCVIFDGTMYHMWFGGHNGAVRRIGYATSPDGINWTKYNDPSTDSQFLAESDPVLDLGPSGSWEDDYVDSPNVLLIDGVFYMWYSGNDDTDKDKYTQSGHATSVDGITWEKDEFNPVLKVGPVNSWDEVMAYQPSVLFDGETFHMWYSGGISFDWRIGYAYSSDGRNWIKGNHNSPVLAQGNIGSWDDTYTGLCTVIFNEDSSGFQMWYSGGDGFVDGDIGYATASLVTGIIENINSQAPAYYLLEQNYPNPFSAGGGSAYGGNPSTTIEYKIPSSNKSAINTFQVSSIQYHFSVSLKVYDVLGREVATLVDQFQNSGQYKVKFDGSLLSSGIYYYTLKAGKISETKKMLIVK